MNGIGREDPYEWKMLFYTDYIKGVRAQKQARERYDKKVKKTLLHAQLSHYGIAHKASKPVADLLQTFRIAMKDRKVSLIDQVANYVLTIIQCDIAPQDLLDLESSLRLEYTKADKENVSNQKQSILAHYTGLESLTARANYSPRLFIEQEFLSKDQPGEESQTGAPIALRGLHNRASIHAAAEHTGLHAVSGGEGDDRTLFIGWDRDAVWSLSQQYSQIQRERRQQKQEEEWKQALEQHHNFVKKLPAKSHKQKFDIDSTEGQYMIRSREIELGWNIDSMTMQITGLDDDWLAEFDLGVITGLMLFDEDPDSLRAQWEEAQHRKF